MNNQLQNTLIESNTNSGLPVLLIENNPNSEEHKYYTVILINKNQRFICGKKGVYKSISSAKKIFNQVVVSY